MKQKRSVEPVKLATSYIARPPVALAMQRIAERRAKVNLNALVSITDAHAAPTLRKPKVIVSSTPSPVKAAKPGFRISDTITVPLVAEPNRPRSSFDVNGVQRGKQIPFEGSQTQIDPHRPTASTSAAPPAPRPTDFDSDATISDEDDVVIVASQTQLLPPSKQPGPTASTSTAASASGWPIATTDKLPEASPVTGLKPRFPPLHPVDAPPIRPLHNADDAKLLAPAAAQPAPIVVQPATAPPAIDPDATDDEKTEDDDDEPSPTLAVPTKPSTIVRPSSYAASQSQSQSAPRPRAAAPTVTAVKRARSSSPASVPPPPSTVKPAKRKAVGDAPRAPIDLADPTRSRFGGSAGAPKRKKPKGSDGF